MFTNRGWTVEAFVNNAFDGMPIAALLLSANHSVLYANPAFTHLTGYHPADIIGRNAGFLLGPDSDPAEVELVLRRRRPYRGEVLLYRKDGEPFWDQIAITPVFDDAGELAGHVSLHDDVTDTRRRKQEGEDTAATARILLTAASDLGAARERGAVARLLGAALVQGGATWASVALETAGEFATIATAEPHGRRAVTGSNPFTSKSFSDEDLGEFLRNSLPRIVSGAEFGSGAAAKAMARRVDRAIVVPLTMSAGGRGLLIGGWPADTPVDRDLLALERATRLADLGAIAFDNLALLEQVSNVADHDALTGAYSRSVLQRRLEADLDTAGGQVAVLYVDLDRFKRVNDSLGHGAGDDLLAQLTRRVMTQLADVRLVSRTGGDEFVIVLTGDLLRQQVDNALAALRRLGRDPFTIGSREVYVGLSVGSTIGHRLPAETPAAAADRLIREADAAMYTEKDHKQRRRRVETPLDVTVLETDLHHAVAADGIGAEFQPQYDARSGRLVGFEALARWRHPTFGHIPPRVFLPLAEESGLIGPLGDRIVEQSFSFAEMASLATPLQININLSARQLHEPDFVPRFARYLGRYPSRTWAVTVEVGEFDILERGDQLAPTLLALQALDVDIAIDNFGSGTSTLELLQLIPATAIKIDKSFVRRSGALRGSMVTAIVNLARSLGLDVMAGNIDNEDQLGTLRLLGCDRLQGRVLSPPLGAIEALTVPRTIDLALDAHRGSTTFTLSAGAVSSRGSNLPLSE